jgi:hypothetical protein
LWWDMGGRGANVSPPSGQIRGENLREDILPSVSPRTSPHVQQGLGQRWARRALGARVTAAAGPRASERGALRVTGFDRRWIGGRPVGWGRGEGSGRSGGR